MEDSIISAGLEWGKDYLPVLNSVPNNIDKINRITQSFYAVTENLPEKISNKFGKTLDVDIILYLGLCNGAGWVTTIGEKTTVLLGIEKIIELDWCDIYSMNGLILHELGHVYQDKYGVLNREIDALQNQFLWQLFTEGIAMVFEQEMVDNPEYYHQDKDGWKNWCTQNLGLINQSFCDDLATMTSSNQRYFGDWVRFHGYSDVGYYLGAYFVRFLLRNDCFDNLISYSIDDVRKQFKMFSEMNH
ncbi:MAG: hypothetical protein J5928_04750 [Firmicutes bacterium]|nr:hypothetical protein [Bacillota bacterium]